MATDALGREIVVGEWYAYSRSWGGFSYTTSGRVLKITPGDGQYKPPKIRLTDCYVKEHIYGLPTDRLLNKVVRDVTISACTVFPLVK